MLHQSHIFSMVNMYHILCHFWCNNFMMMFDMLFFRLCLFVRYFIDATLVFLRIMSTCFFRLTTHLSITWFKIHNIQIMKCISSSKPFPFTDLQLRIFWMLFLFPRYYFLRAFFNQLVLDHHCGNMMDCKALCLLDVDNT